MGVISELVKSKIQRLVTEKIFLQTKKYGIYEKFLIRFLRKNENNFSSIIIHDDWEYQATQLLKYFINYSPENFTGN